MVDKLRTGAARLRAGQAVPVRQGDPRRAERRAAPHPGMVWSDLPLFPVPQAPEPIVRGGRPQASRPLSVRRRTPRVPRRLRGDPVPSRAETDLLAADRGIDGGADPARASGPPPAAPGRRVAAGIADLLLLGAVDGAVVVLTARLLGMPIAAAAGLPWLPLGAFLVLFDAASVVTLTALGGQTPGKMAAGIRVVAVDGGQVTVSRAIARTALTLLSLLPAGLGFVALLARSRRTVHDRLAGTRVVRAVPS